MDEIEKEFTLMISEEKLRKIMREEIAKWYKEEVSDPQIEFMRKVYEVESRILRGEDGYEV